MGRIRLKLEHLEKWLSLIANMGVLAGIFMVAAQLNLSTRAIEIQNGLAAGAFSNAAEVAFMGESTHEAYAKALFNPSQLSPAEMQQVWAYLQVGINSSAAAWSAYQADLVDEEVWILQKYSAASYVNFRVGRIWWEETKGQFYPEDFVQEIDSVLKTYDPMEMERTAFRIQQQIEELPDAKSAF